MTMSAEKTLAIILKAVDYSETSCIITLLTKSSGKISSLAKGARRPKGPFFVAIDVLSLSQVMFLPRRSSNLDLLTEAKLQRRFRPCQWSLARLYAGYYIAELLLELTEPHQSLPELFDQTVRTLDDLQRPETDFLFQPVSAILLRFELQALSLLGHGLGLTHCSNCDQKIYVNDIGPLSSQKAELPSNIRGAVNARNLTGTQSQANTKLQNHPSSPTKYSQNGRAFSEKNNRFYFSLLDSSLLCSQCASGRRELVELTPQAVKLLRTFQNQDDQLWRQQSAGAIDSNLRSMMDSHWRMLLNRKLKLQSAVRQIVAKEKKTLTRPDQS